MVKRVIKAVVSGVMATILFLGSAFFVASSTFGLTTYMQYWYMSEMIEDEYIEDQMMRDYIEDQQEEDRLERMQVQEMLDQQLEDQMYEQQLEQQIPEYEQQYEEYVEQQYEEYVEQQVDEYVQQQVDEYVQQQAPNVAGPVSACDPSYPDICFPAGEPDMDCNDILDRRFRVLPPDPHRFDGDNDGVGCESG